MAEETAARPDATPVPVDIPVTAAVPVTLGLTEDGDFAGEYLAAVRGDSVNLRDKPGVEAGLVICCLPRDAVVLVTGEELPPEARQTTFTNMMKIGLEIAVKMANK